MFLSFVQTLRVILKPGGIFCCTIVDSDTLLQGIIIRFTRIESLDENNETFQAYFFQTPRESVRAMLTDPYTLDMHKVRLENLRPVRDPIYIRI